MDKNTTAQKTDPRALTTDEQVNDNDITQEERDMLDALDENSNVTEADLDKVALDDTDNEGEPLSEKGSKQDKFGEDLDTPPEELWDDAEDVEEDDGTLN